jgi:hypothetical protein
MAGSSDSKKVNGLGVASLVIGIIAILFAFVPLLNVLVPLFALIGLVLGVVGIFIKKSKKGLAIAGSILSGLSIILSMSLASLYADSFNSEFSPDSEVVDDGQSSPDDDGNSDQGTRDNPLPLGTTITLGSDWEVVVGPSTLDANSIIADENMFNEPAPEGFQYAILSLTFTYIGESSGTPWTAVNVDYVSASGNTHSPGDSSAVAPDALFSINELFPGATASGNVAIAIPTDGALDGVWRVEPSFLGDGFFFKAE